jgi:ankyrin repeat protein
LKNPSRIQRALLCLLAHCMVVADLLADDAPESVAPVPGVSSDQSAMDADAAALDLALWSAAADGNIDLFNRLLASGARVQGAGVPTTALWIASQQGETEIVKRLLALGTDVEAQDAVDGRTALYQAAQEGHTSVVRLLLASGAHTDVSSIRTGATPLFMAAARGHAEVVRLLLAARADINALANADGVVDSPLSIAKKRGYDDIVEMIERSGDIDLTP